MRFTTALGGFLALCGFVILVLRPVVNVGGARRLDAVEATEPAVQYRPIPPWVGAAGILTGAALLGLSWFTANRR